MPRVHSAHPCIDPAAPPPSPLQEAQELLEGVREYARTLAASPATIDYFATSLPTMLTFHDDLQVRQVGGRVGGRVGVQVQVQVQV